MDSGRKDFSDKLQDKATPNSQKSTVDKLSEGVTSTTDKAQRDLLPDSEKSTGQSMSDKMSRQKDSHKGGESMLDKAKDTIGLNKH